MSELSPSPEHPEASATSDYPHPPRLSARELAQVLGQHPPTPEQEAVIEAPLRPLLVVAGAGSGKTETMAARVVWLVANGYLQPEEVLGLTFTRKAASELADRLSSRLATLRAERVWQPTADGGAHPLLTSPTVTTYHSYAGSLVRDQGLRLGVEGDARLLSEAAAWQIAHEAVVSYDGPMAGVTKAESTITSAVLDLAGECAEHLVSLTQVEAALTEVIDTLESVPKGSSRKRQLPASVQEVATTLRERRAVLPIVERFAALKSRREAVDFADHLHLAARLARTFPEIGALHRARFRAVLLDEFQDTSEAQLQLLTALFVAEGERVNVTAVGDPHQSIYGWRGASATTLPRFASSFVDPDPARVLPLSTSWRNDVAVLHAANTIADPLTRSSAVGVQPLSPRPGAGPGHVLTARLTTMEEEAAYVGDWLAQARAVDPSRSAAVLCRKRSQFDAVIAALQERDLPYEVVGLGGLLSTPEVADLIALLTVVDDPSRGDQLMRLLTGPAVRLGAADLDGLWAWARVLAAGRAPEQSGRAATDSPSAPRAPDPDLGDASLGEALADLPPAQWAGSAGERVGDVARQRLQALAHIVDRLRGLVALPLPDLVVEAERALGLDIEVLARPEYSPAAARSHLDAFAEVAAQFAASSDRPGVGPFLAWLDAALTEERGLELGWIETRSDAVSVLTVHAAKGLEWDVVAVPGLTEGVFPALNSTSTRVQAGEWVTSPPTDRAWLGGLSAIPHDLRGDADGRPRFAWDRLVDWDGADAELKRYLAAAGAAEIDEERRLAYVAVTRARSAVLLTTHVWGSAKTPRATSRFLRELRDADLPSVSSGPWCDLPDPLDPSTHTNPRLAEEALISWPVQPLADRHAPAARAAREMASVGRSEVVEETPSRWSAETDLLLAERDLRAAHSREPVLTLPAHLSTSQLLALSRDRTAYAERLRRPMPQPPARVARAGTAFHSWVEGHFGAGTILDIDELPGSADAEADPFADLESLKASFLASGWARRAPVEIETAVETVIAGVAIRGRIDAVFADDAGFVIVDWKTGAPPTGAAARVAAVQLAAYRIGWSRLRGVPIEQVRAAFFYARSGETVYPELPTEADLVSALGAAPAPQE